MNCGWTAKRNFQDPVHLRSSSPAWVWEQGPREGAITVSKCRTLYGRQVSCSDSCRRCSREYIHPLSILIPTVIHQPKTDRILQFQFSEIFRFDLYFVGSRCDSLHASSHVHVLYLQRFVCLFLKYNWIELNWMSSATRTSLLAVGRCGTIYRLTYDSTSDTRRGSKGGRNRPPTHLIGARVSKVRYPNIGGRPPQPSVSSVA